MKEGGGNIFFKYLKKSHVEEGQTCPVDGSIHINHNTIRSYLLRTYYVLGSVPSTLSAATYLILKTALKLSLIITSIL